MTKAKPFDISKREVWEAFKKVKANQGAAGVDGQSIGEFEANLADNLYKLWNRLSSGSYLPPPVRRVDIPKAKGGTRPLGIPTVADRIAQEVVRRYLEPLLEPRFHADSYGYRSGRSAIDAIRTARQRCWRANWVVDLDIQGFFDSIDRASAQGAPQTRGLPLDAALCRALVEGPDPGGGWKDGASHDRNATRGRSESTAGKPVSALCVRPVDGENASAHIVRAVCR